MWVPHDVMEMSQFLSEGDALSQLKDWINNVTYQAPVTRGFLFVDLGQSYNLIGESLSLIGVFLFSRIYYF